MLDGLVSTHPSVTKKDDFTKWKSGRSRQVFPLVLRLHRRPEVLLLPRSAPHRENSDPGVSVILFVADDAVKEAGAFSLACFV